MKPEKIKKIRAMLNNPASTDNEKAICRKLLAKHMEETPEDRPPIFNPSFKTPEQDWNRHKASPFTESAEDAFRRQTAQAQNFAFYNQHTGQDAAHRRDQRAAAAAQGASRQQAAQQGHAQDIFNGLFGGGFGFGGVGQAQDPPINFSQAEFEQAQANINAQRKAQEKNVDDLILKKKHNFLHKFSKLIKGDKRGQNEGD